ncbi:hypothetical protein [Xanthomonas phaseoli]|uniref:hypothetical protein n=1 Tax=Xanthomonas phaseoli TaxID=1985254 RepID=UPI001267723C|nr:hypothetical protein [Xanthomonas phaseoli]
MVVVIGRYGQGWCCRCSKTRSFRRTGATSTPAGAKNLLLCRSDPGRDAIHAFHPLLKLDPHHRITASPHHRITASPHRKESFTVRNGLSLASLSFCFGE